MTFYIEKVNAKNQFKLSVEYDIYDIHLEFFKNKEIKKRYSFMLQEFIDLINDYHQNGFGINEPYINRKYIITIKSIIEKSITDTEINIYIELARILAILPFFYPKANKDSIISKVERYLSQENSKLYNYACVDWTGNLGTQPSIYFIPKDLYENLNDLNDLHNLELLDCIYYESCRYYYLPFSKSIDNISQTKFLKHKTLIQKIIHARNKNLMGHFNE